MTEVTGEELWCHIKWCSKLLKRKKQSEGKAQLEARAG